MLSPEHLKSLSDAQRTRLKAALAEKEHRESRALFYRLFPDVDTLWRGPSILGGLIKPGQVLHAREKYGKHLEFFRAGATCRERCFMAANRVGKTLSGGGYELAAHLTGEYPDWWEGRRFKDRISAWAVGVTYTTTRDILQTTLLGETGTRSGRQVPSGCGVIPGHCLGAATWNSHVRGLVDEIRIQHASGKWSKLQFKSYQEGRDKFQGTGKHVVLLDEEPPLDVYTEALMRTTTLNGLAMLTFTPLHGMSEVVQSFVSK